jgi:hypothetical protein
MKSNIRRTFRPTLDVFEDRLVPSSFSWGTVNSPDFAAVLTAAQPAPALLSWSQGAVNAAVLTAAPPAPALSSFQWGIGRGVSDAMLSGWNITTQTGGAAVPLISEIVVTKIMDGASG